MASGPITAWQTEGKTVETVTDFLSWAPKSQWMVTGHEIRRQLLISRKAMTNLDSVLQSRDFTLLTKVCVQCYGPPSSQTEFWELDCKEGKMPKNWWLLYVPWIARRPYQSILRDINPECSRKRLMLKLKLQYFGHLMQTDNSLEKSLMLGKMKGRRTRGWDGWTASLMQWTWTWAISGRRWGTGKPGVLQSKRSQRVGHDWPTEQQQHYMKAILCFLEFW